MFNFTLISLTAFQTLFDINLQNRIVSDNNQICSEENSPCFHFDIEEKCLMLKLVTVNFHTSRCQTIKHSSESYSSAPTCLSK